MPLEQDRFGLNHFPIEGGLGRSVNPALHLTFRVRFTSHMEAEVLPCETIAL